MYYDLMSLYGDWANAEVLALELKARGADVVIDKKTVDDEINFGDYDLLYIGSGTERSLIACIADISKQKAALLERIDEGMHVLATGNSHEIFGMVVTDNKGTKHDALGLIDFETVQGNGRVTGDCICKASFLEEKLVGFINRASIGQIGRAYRPFDVLLGPGASDESETGVKTEAIEYKNLLGTYLTGPILIRNPPLLRHFTDRILGEQMKTCANQFSEIQETAYKKTLEELSKRIGEK